MTQTSSPLSPQEAQAYAARARSILSVLSPLYPEQLPLLHFQSPFQLLCATVLSAQCTDARVNLVTPELFRRWGEPASLAAADPAELESVIHSTGFFRAKARNLIGLSRILAERYDSEVPQTMEELVQLPGVGRKTAGVILSACFGKGAIIVDTHFGRVSRRLGFARSEDPVKLEREIAAFLSESLWTEFSMVLNFHGRRFCHSRKPDCPACPVRLDCPSAIS